MEFQQEDIGKRVLLILDLTKLDEEDFDCEQGYFNVPYESIKDYRFFKIARVSKSPRIENIGPKKRKINPVYLGKEVGASIIRTIGDIEELTDSYLRIKVWARKELQEEE